MYVPDEMKANKLVQVVIPKGKDLYNMNPNGLPMPPASAYTGDVPASGSRSKIQELEDIMRYDEMMQREEMKDSKDSE